MSQQLMLNPLGIITQPNQMGSIPPGAFRQAYAGYIRDPGVLEPAIDWTEALALGSVTTGGSAAPKMYVLTFPNSSSTYCLLFWQHANGNWAFSWTDLAASGAPYSDFLYTELGYLTGGQQYLSQAGRVSWLTSRQRTLLACDVGVVAWDYVSPSTGTEAKPRQAGLQPPDYISPNAINLNGSALLVDRWCHVTAVLRRKFADGYELVSAPCPATPVFNTQASTAVNIIHGVGIPRAFTRVGDVVEVYRTRSAYFEGPTSGSAPWASSNTDSDYYKSCSLTLTSDDITAGVVYFDDATPDENLGESLYTNDGQNGAAAAANPPPTNRVMCMFRGHAHFFNLTTPPQFRIRNAVAWGPLSHNAGGSFNASARTYGVGLRYFQGTSTSGSATITGISGDDMLGLVKGQYIYNGGTAWTAWSARITAVGASSITLSTNAATSLSGVVFSVSDVIEIDGTDYSATSVDQLNYDMQAQTPYRFKMFLLARVAPGVRPSMITPTIPAEYAVISMYDFWGSSTAPTRQSFSVRATNGHLYDPPLPRFELSQSPKVFAKQEVKNGWAWSEKNQPENVPPANYNTLGSGEVYGAYETRDACFVFASDGLWRISGNGGDAGSGYDWRADLVHKSIRLAGPQACVAMHDVGYAYTNLGFVSIDSSGNVTQVSEGVIGDRLPGLTWPATLTYTPSTCVFMVADPDKNEIILREPQGEPNIFWRYNARSNTWMWDYAGSAPIHGAYSEFIKAPIVALSVDFGKVWAQNGTTYRAMDVRYHPVFADSPFTQKRWQLVNVVADDVTSPVTVSCNDVVVGTRTLTAGGHGYSARQGFAIQRAAGALGNSLSVSLFVAAGSVKTRLQGVALSYVTFTDQRHKR